MASIPSNKLTLLPFPQSWASGKIGLRVVVLPRGSPRKPLMEGIPPTPDGPPFDGARLRLKAMLIPGLDELPDPAHVTAELGLGTTTPAGLIARYKAVELEFDIDPALEPAISPRGQSRQFRKLLVPSYRNAFAFSGPRTRFAVTDDSYACALRNTCRTKQQQPPLNRKTVWGRIIAQALRQPVLAEWLGLLYRADMTPPPHFFQQGGWLYVTLAAGSDYLPQVAAKPELLSVYAARIPALTAQQDRALFAAVLFPVSAAPPTGNFDELFREAAVYDDGFAQIVHCAQLTTADPAGLEDAHSPPPVRDTGIQLGWDDEQILIWKNRQIANPANETRDAPMGVMGYRVDVRPLDKNHPNAPWYSMMEAQADLELGKSPHITPVGAFHGELTIEVGPLQLDNLETGDYWMPAYFAEWQGRSMVTADTLGQQLSGGSQGLTYHYQPLEDDKVPLRYGRSYEFRVRLADVSGGGSVPGASRLHPAPAPVAVCPFRRHVRPGEVAVEGMPPVRDPAHPPQALAVYRPRLGYPAALFGDVPNVEQALLDDLAVVQGLANQGREPGVPDPDVDRLRICVQVAGLELDPANSQSGPLPLREVYTIERPFPADPGKPLDLKLDYQDVTDIIDSTQIPVPKAGDPIVLPRARDVVITFTALGRDDPGLDYFGSELARIGRASEVRLRCVPKDERTLLGADEGDTLRAIYLQPDEAATPSLMAMLVAMGKGVEAETGLVGRLAAELDLDVHGLTLSARPGERTVFGCSGAIPHILAPDGSAIAFSSKADLALRWITVVTLRILRDWTWDGAGDPALVFTRTDPGADQEVGRVYLRRSLCPTVFEGPRAAGAELERSWTRIAFFDAVDVREPVETEVGYQVVTQFKDKQPPQDQDDPLQLDIKHLPITVLPDQTPKLAAAGIALSPYVAAEDYSSTAPRERLLWLECTEPVEKSTDRYFARVLCYAPDPMLTRGQEVTVPPEPPLPIDPEYIRVIRPISSDDKAGLNAMQALIPTDSPLHFLVPLPPGLQGSSRELFGMFVYELRAGHFEDWSTAQGRFGPALRVTGVQHPAPPLLCQVYRTAHQVFASAPLATPVLDGRSLLPYWPATEIWFVLYAQVTQADGQAQRNILLGQKRGMWDEKAKTALDVGADRYVGAMWAQLEITKALAAYGLPVDSPLSVLAVELLPERPWLGETYVMPDLEMRARAASHTPAEGGVPDPLGGDLGQVRILRTSPLARVSDVCPDPPCP